MNNEYRFYQLTYCSICKLRDLNIEKGIICSLTNDQAKFVNKCPDYNFDSLELKKTKKNIAQEIEYHYSEKKYSAFNQREPYFIKKENIKIDTKKKENTYNKTFKETDYKIVIISFSGSIAFISILLGFLDPELFFITIISLIMGLIFYQIESKKIKKNILFKEDYFLYGSTKIYWREILEYGISTMPNEEQTTEEVHLFTINRGVIKIKIENYENLGPTKMIAILNYNKSELAD